MAGLGALAAISVLAAEPVHAVDRSEHEPFFDAFVTDIAGRYPDQRFTASVYDPGLAAAMTCTARRTDHNG